MLPSIVFWVVLAAVLRVGVVPPESCGDTDPAALESAARASAAWIMRNQHDDGSYTYVYLSDSDTIPDDYNIVRHAGVTMSLYQAAGYFEDRKMLSAADAGMGWLVDHLESRHGWSAPVLGEDEVSLGAVGLMTVSLAERRLVTGDTQYDGVMHDLGRFMLAVQHEDGGFGTGWDLRTDSAIAGTSRYYPGEALWGLALLAEAFPDEGWDDAAWKALDYIITKRDAEAGIDFPPLPDQWLAYGLAEMADWGLADRDIEHATALAGRFGLLVRTSAQRQGGAIGRLVKGREARAAGLGTWVEGLGSMWRLASLDPRFAGEQPKIEERLVCSAGILAARQTDADEAADSARPGLVEGAWVQRGETRMDDQQHALSGLIYTLRALKGLPRVSDTPVLVTP